MNPVKAKRSGADPCKTAAVHAGKLSSYTVVDLGARYRWRFLEVGIAVENLSNTLWNSTEFFYESRPKPTGPAIDDFHFTPGNPRNVRGWISGYF